MWTQAQVANNRAVVPGELVMDDVLRFARDNFDDTNAATFRGMVATLLTGYQGAVPQGTARFYHQYQRLKVFAWKEFLPPANLRGNSLRKWYQRNKNRRDNNTVLRQYFVERVIPLMEDNNGRQDLIDYMVSRILLPG
jgi:hypothetical protein